MTNHTFSQRYGYEPLPQPMQLEEISADLRREIWNATRKLFLSIRGSYGGGYYFESEASRFIERALGRVLGRPEDEIDSSYSTVLALFKGLILHEPFNVVLDLIEIMADEILYTEESHLVSVSESPTEIFAYNVQDLFEIYPAAYWLDTEHRPYQFFPRSNKAQGDATQEAIKTIREGGMKGAATHLRQAAKQINARQYAKSIEDSIHAVESVARVIDPKGSKTLGPALNSLWKAGLLKHQAFKKGIEQLYGYTNDEQGIRHALLDKNSPDVGLDEAMFMFGACASFAAYLVSKHQHTEQQ